ncbi:MAG TPA: tetratricopeptide repeat protein [Chthoniobacterales bacterium]|nr:tetratricopeptide repeat protein [Chthoniobacterales bacterium]
MKTQIRLWMGTMVVALLFVSAATLQAADDATFAKANQAYSEGRFQEAVDGYQGFVEAGRWNANLFYNLGNAWFRVGDFGKAILNYERARALDPHHPEASANLRLARDEARALELRKNGMELYVAMATPTQYAVAAAIAFWFVLFGVTRLFFSPRRSAGRLAMIAFATAGCVLFIFALYTLENGAQGRALAIVTGKDIEARVATADSASSVLTLPPGSEIKVLSERGEWVYAALPNEQRGWIPARAVERVRL